MVIGLKEITASGSVLKVTSAVEFKSYQNGKAIRSSMLRMASKFQNAALYLRCFPLEMLIPVTGLQVVSRCGHTELYRKLYLSQSHSWCRRLSQAIKKRLPSSYTCMLYNRTTLSMICMGVPRGYCSQSRKKSVCLDAQWRTTWTRGWHNKRLADS